MSTTSLYRNTPGIRSRTSPRRRQKGFDLVQIAIVIGVIGILMAAAFVGVPAIMASVRATGEARDLQSYVMRQQQDISPGAIDNKSVIAAGHYNEANVDSKTGKILNRFGGNVVIASSAGDGRFSITSSSVPYRACEKLIPIIAPAFEAIKVGGTDVKTATSPLASSANIVAACAGSTGGEKSTSGTVEIVYTAPR